MTARRRILVGLVLVCVANLLSSCAVFDPPVSSYDLNHGPLADAIAAAKPGVPR